MIITELCFAHLLIYKGVLSYWEEIVSRRDVICSLKNTSNPHDLSVEPEVVFPSVLCLQLCSPTVSHVLELKLKYESAGPDDL